ncbi:MAG: hypothetical protein M1827_004178 [Pycnora praestabilis]|nr:MAG: hypothetical protein M1827_004178 [Pycnora praestabilis]
MRLSTVLTTLSSLPFLLASPYPFDAPADGALAPRAAQPNCPGHPTSEAHQRTLFAGFVNALYGQKNVSLAFDTYVDVNLIEHDPFDAQGRAANAAKLAAIIPYTPFTVLRSSFDANTGFIHVKVDDPQDALPIALADIYRMNGTCIVEHWDVTQETPANATNPIAMF